MVMVLRLEAAIQAGHRQRPELGQCGRWRFPEKSAGTAYSKVCY